MNAASERKAKKTLFIVGMLAIPAVHLAVFFFYVNFDAILMAFKVQKGREMLWGMENFTRFFKEFKMPNSQISESFVNTLIFFFTDLLIKFPLGIVMCYFIYKKVAGYKAFRVIFYLPCIISGSVYVTLFKYIIGAEGPLGLLLTAMGKEPLPLLADSRYALKTIVFYTIFTSIGGNIIMLGGALNHIDDSVTEAAAIDGASLKDEFFKIVLPLIWPTVSTLLILSFAGIFSASGPILLFTEGAYGTFTISYWLYYQVQVYGANTNYPAAVGLIFTCIGTPIALFMRYLANKVPSYED